MEKIKELLKNPLILYGTIGIGMIIIVVIIAIVIVPLFSKKSYEQLEEELLEAAQSYYNDKQSNYPKKIGSSVSITSSQLISSGYLSELKDPSNKENTCSGTVKVMKTSEEKYNYYPLISCGDNYQTKTLLSVFTEKVATDSNTDGIHKINDEYVFRGENVNNYIKMNDKIWYIIKATKNGEIKVFLSDSSDETNIFDDRYNSEKGWNTGYNSYLKSRVKDRLNQYYQTELLNIQDFIVPMNLCIGGRKLDETNNSGTVECSNILENQYIGLLQANEYIIASLDTNCNQVEQEECSNYNYFNKISDSFWTITPNLENTHEVYQVYGGLSVSNASSYSKIFPVIYLNSDVIYAGGTGTLDDPYLIR